jgi:AraC-like DNA-binding protein
MEILTNWLAPAIGRLLRVHHARTGGEWGVEITSRQTVMLRFMLAGGCWVTPDKQEPFRFEAGDVLIVRAIPHCLSSAVGFAGQSVEAFNSSQLGYDGPITDEFICVAFDTDYAQATFPPLRPIIYVPAAQIAESKRFASIIDAVREECQSPEVASEVMLKHLMEALLLCTLRSYFERAGNEEWIASMIDPLVVKALQMMHDDFGRRWTVESLASSVGSSRAVFARRFAQEVGMPPLTYLSDMRMKIAARSLANRSEALSKVALSVGYESEAAFSRAFKRVFGLPPDEFRRLDRDTIKRADGTSGLETKPGDPLA